MFFESKRAVKPRLLLLLLPEYDGYCKIYTDGSKCNEKSASAFHTAFGSTRSFRILDNSSVFTAEVEAIRAALKYIRISHMSKFIIFSDSKSVLEALNSQDSKNPLINFALQTIYTIMNNGKLIKFCWIPSHIGIKGNENVDRAARDAIHFPDSGNFKVPYTDKFPQVKKYVHECWQQFWHEQNNQKLYEIKPIIGEFNVSSLSRREQVVIHRIRIGHTRLTHSFRMEGRPNAPLCEYCDEELTVKHFMIHCSHYTTIRRRFYNVDNMKDLFEKVSLRRIISFLKESELFKLL